MCKYLNTNLLAVILLFFSSPLIAQADCILGVGVTNDSVLIDVFQLNVFQSKRLIKSSGEVKYRQDILDNKLENIRARHPQSNVAELSELAREYNIVMDSMAMVQRMIDKRILSLFNQKQYELYRSLCWEASRSPFIVAPRIYKDTAIADVEKQRSSFLDNLKD